MIRTPTKVPPQYPQPPFGQCPLKSKPGFTGFKSGLGGGGVGHESDDGGHKAEVQHANSAGNNEPRSTKPRPKTPNRIRSDNLFHEASYTT